jgi:hypothetical protein
MSVGWRPAEKLRDRQRLQSFTCAPKGAPSYQAEVQRFLRGRAQAAVNRATKADDSHLLLLFDNDDLAGAVMHSLRPKLPHFAAVSGRVIEYIGVSLAYQGQQGKRLSNETRASTSLLGLAMAHIASRPLQPELVAAAIHTLNEPSRKLFARFGVDKVMPATEPYRVYWAAWDQAVWQNKLPDPLG